MWVATAVISSLHCRMLPRYDVGIKLLPPPPPSPLPPQSSLLPLDFHGLFLPFLQVHQHLCVLGGARVGVPGGFRQGGRTHGPHLPVRLPHRPLPRLCPGGHRQVDGGGPAGPEPAAAASSHGSPVISLAQYQQWSSLGFNSSVLFISLTVRCSHLLPRLLCVKPGPVCHRSGLGYQPPAQAPHLRDSRLKCSRLASAWKDVLVGPWS